MRYYLAACFLGLVLGVALGLLLVTLDEDVESFDPNDTSAFLRLVARGLRAIEATARDLADTVITAYTEQNPPPPAGGMVTLGGDEGDCACHVHSVRPALAHTASVRRTRA